MTEKNESQIARYFLEAFKELGIEPVPIREIIKRNKRKNRDKNQALLQAD